MMAVQRLQQLVIAPADEVIPVEENEGSDSGEEDFYEQMLAEKDTAQTGGKCYCQKLY